MGRRVLRCHILGYSVCLCPIKRTPGLYGLTAYFFNFRCMWLIMTIACICAVGYQIYERVSFFGSWPVNVNVEINYNKSLQFPAVTICNQNSFRATKAAEFGLYDLIDETFAKSATFQLDYIKSNNATNITIEDLIVNLGHDKYDLFFSCSWKNTDCSPEDFIPVLTDHGLCYTFSPNSSEMAISAPGIDSGLKLMLNIEQYEYMNGPHDSAGVKILLHDPRQTPLVGSLGQAVSNGVSAFAAINLLMIEYQSPPYGDCGSKPLNHTTFYTAEECFLDCMTAVVTEKCGCRDIYMATDGHADSAICTLEQYFGCIKDAKDAFFGMFEHLCNCPVSCEVAIFEPIFSDGSLSDHAVDSLLSSNQTASLYRKLLEALEAKAKMDKRKQAEFRILAEPLKEIYTQYNQLLHILPQLLQNQSKMLIEARNEFKYINTFLYWYRDCQLYAFNLGILQNKDSISNYLSESTDKFYYIWFQRLQRLLNMSDTQDANREVIYNQTVEDLRLRKYLIRNAQYEIDSLFNFFKYGEISRDSLFLVLNQSYIDHFVPKSVMKDIFLYPFTTYSNPLLDTIMYCQSELYNIYSNLYVVIDQWIELTETAFHNPERDSVDQVISDIITNYANVTLKFNSCRYILNKLIFRFPILWLELGQDLSFMKLIEFDGVFLKADQTIRYLEEIVQHSIRIMNSAFKTFSDVTNEYVESKKHSLASAYSVFLSENVQSAIQHLKDFSFEIDTNEQALHEYITSLIDIPSILWFHIGKIHDEVFDVYSNSNPYDFELALRNHTAAEMAYNVRLEQARDNFDIRTFLGNIDHDFIKAIDDVSRYLDKFNKSVRIDNIFFRKNFLKLNVFYRQLSYEYIRQQKGYDIYGLICDIGGSLGLFIGASMLTVVEVIDLLLGQTPVFRKKTKPNRNSSDTSDTCTQRF